MLVFLPGSHCEHSSFSPPGMGDKCTSHSAPGSFTRKLFHITGLCTSFVPKVSFLPPRQHHCTQHCGLSTELNSSTKPSFLCRSWSLLGVLVVSGPSSLHLPLTRFCLPICLSTSLEFSGSGWHSLIYLEIPETSHRWTGGSKAGRTGAQGQREAPVTRPPCVHCLP